MIDRGKLPIVTQSINNNKEVSCYKNIVTIEAAIYAAFYIYVIKFLSKYNDKNLITFSTGGSLNYRVDDQGNKQYYVLNGHGDVEYLVNSDGDVLNSYTM